jgi:hypothetical protein
LCNEKLFSFTQKRDGIAIYVAHLIHRESKAIIKVVGDGLTLASFPDEETLQSIEKYIAQRWPHNQLFTHPR